MNEINSGNIFNSFSPQQAEKIDNGLKEARNGDGQASIDSIKTQMDDLDLNKWSMMLYQAEQADQDIAFKTTQDSRKHRTDTVAAVLNNIQDTGNKLNNAGTQTAKGINF